MNEISVSWRVIVRTIALLEIVFGGTMLVAEICGAEPVPNLGMLDNHKPAEGFAQALEVREFQFPRDHGPHSDYRQEWWYLTGNLDSTTGERFGFELTFFRFALAPPSATITSTQHNASGESRWRTRQIYMAHFAVTDVSRRQFRFAEKLSRGALGLAGAQAEPLQVWIDDWSLKAESSNSRPELSSSGGNARWMLRAANEHYELSLEAQPLLPPILNGDRGLSRKSDEPGSASYYYSIPRVAIRGRLLRDGRPLDVQGLAWFDREWGSGDLGRSEQGWDWFALQMKDGSTLMFYSLRNRDGHRDHNSAGTWVDAAGQPRALSNEDVQIDVGDYWTNSRGERYPARWHLRVPAIGLEVDVRPVLADQELGTAPRYWEGAVDLIGTRSGGRIEGRGYVELVGYAKTMQVPMQSLH